MNILYRNATVDDCLNIAEGIDRASGGILKFLLHDLTAVYTRTEFMAALLRDETGHDSYKNALVAEFNNEIVGIVYSYPSAFHGISEEAKSFYPSDRLALLADFFNSRVEKSFFLDSIYVDANFRGQGIGNQLIALTKEKAKACGYQQLSLMVMHSNMVARRAYERNEFRIVKHIDVDDHPLIENKGGIYLLVSDIA